MSETTPVRSLLLVGLLLGVCGVAGRTASAADPLLERDAQPILQRTCVGNCAGVRGPVRPLDRDPRGRG